MATPLRATRRAFSQCWLPGEGKAQEEACVEEDPDLLLGEGFLEVEARRAAGGQRELA